MWISRYLQEMFYQPLLAALASLEAANYLFIYCHTRSNSNQSSLFGAETREARIHSWKQVMNRETSTTTGDTVNQLLARCFTPVKRAEDFRRGNIEELLSVHLFRLPLKEVLADPACHHVLISLVADLEQRRGKRFLSGYDSDVKPAKAGSHRSPWSFIPLSVRFTLSSIGWITASVGLDREIHSVTATVPVESTPDPKMRVLTSSPPLVPASSIAMGISMSNLSCIGMNPAPPLRTRQRSRTVNAVLPCASFPVSSLAMMPSLSNLSSVGLCTAPPLRTRLRSRTVISTVGYTSTIPLMPTVPVAAMVAQLRAAHPEPPTTERAYQRSYQYYSISHSDQL